MNASPTRLFAATLAASRPCKSVTDCASAVPATSATPPAVTAMRAAPRAKRCHFFIAVSFAFQFQPSVHATVLDTTARTLLAATSSRSSGCTGHGFLVKSAAPVLPGTAGAATYGLYLEAAWARC